MRSIVVILFLLNSAIFTQEDNEVRKWEQINLPEVIIPWNGNNIDLDDITMLDIHFLESNEDYGWISGFNSVILRTSDGGDTWIPSFVDQRRSIQTESVWFLNENVGYASGPVIQSYDPNQSAQNFSGAVYKSIDGGETWQEITPFLQFADIFGNFVIGATNIWGLYFLDENNGWVLGGNCNEGLRTRNFGNSNMFFYRTQDGGESWSLEAKNVANLDTKLADLIMNENGTGYAVSSGYLWETTNFGDDWVQFSETGGNDWHEDISIFNNSIVVPYSITCSGSLDDEGGVRVTTDFGQTWNDYRTGYDMYGAYMHSDTRAFAVGRGNSLYQTLDGGQTWFVDNFCLQETFLDDLYYLNEETIWTVGDGIFKSYFDVVVELEEEPDTLFACRGDQVILEIEPNYTRYEWLEQNNFTRKLTTTAEDIKLFKARYFDQECPDSIFTKEFYVISNPDPEVDVEISPELACEGEFYEVTVNSEVPFEWYDETTGEFISSENSVTITEDIELRLEYSSTFGCGYSSNYQLEFAPLPSPEIASRGDQEFCIGESVELTLDSDYPGIKWMTNETGLVQEGGSSFDANVSGNYYVIAENEFGCIDSSNVISVEVRNDTNQLDFSARYTGEFLKIPDPETGERACGYVILENFSWKPLTLNNPALVNNDEFSIPADQLPIELEPFGLDSILVCFKSVENGLREDTLLIPDLCFDHYIPLNGNVRFNDFESGSRCDLTVLYETFGQTDFYTIHFGTPFPNPADNFTFAQFVEFSPDGEESQVMGEMLDQLGNKVLDAEVRILEETADNGGILRRGEIFFDTSQLMNGAYQLVLNSPTENETFSVVLSR